MKLNMPCESLCVLGRGSCSQWTCMLGGCAGLRPQQPCRACPVCARVQQTCET